eukprot:scaffold149_cov315-Pinguiococcus_pyrenoidosus.AAC.18
MYPFLDRRSFFEPWREKQNLKSDTAHALSIHFEECKSLSCRRTGLVKRKKREPTRTETGVRLLKLYSAALAGQQRRLLSTECAAESPSVMGLRCGKAADVEETAGPGWARNSMIDSTFRENLCDYHTDRKVQDDFTFLRGTQAPPKSRPRVPSKNERAREEEKRRNERMRGY